MFGLQCHHHPFNTTPSMCMHPLYKSALKPMIFTSPAHLSKLSSLTRNLYIHLLLLSDTDMASRSLLFLSFLAIFISLSSAFEPSPLQDFCVAANTGATLVNGLACKDPKLAQAEDFFFSGLHLVGNTSNPLGSRVTPVNVAQLPGLNTLGISMVRIDYAPWGVNPPHTHPRATEILTVLEGSLTVGFVTSNPDNRLITKVLRKGDVFVFPVGLVHFQRNAGYAHAVAIAALSSQNPGAITIANAVFGSKPSIPTEVLSKAFQVDTNVVNQLQIKF